MNIEKGLVKDEDYGFVFYYPRNWILLYTGRRNIVAAESPEKDCCAAFIYLDEEVSPEDIVSKILKLWKNVDEVSLTTLSKGNNLIKIKAESSEDSWIVYLRRKLFKEKIDLSKGTSILATGSVFQTEFSCLYQNYKNFLGSLTERDLTTSTSSVEQYFSELLKPIEKTWVLFYIVAAESDFPEERALKILDMVSGSKKTFSGIGNDAPFRIVYNPTFYFTGLRWMVEIPATWSINSAILNEDFEAYSFTKRVSITIISRELSDNFNSYVIEQIKRMLTNNILLGYSIEENKAYALFRSRDATTTTRAIWQKFSLKSASGILKTFVLISIYRYPTRIERDVMPVINRIIRSWRPLQYYLAEHLGLIPLTPRVQEVYASMQRRAAQVALEEARKEIAHRRRLMKTAQKTFSEIRAMHEDMMRKQREYSAKYTQTMSSILGKPWPISQPSSRPIGTGVSAPSTSGSPRRKSIRDYDWAGGGATFFLDSEGRLRSRDYGEEIVADRIGDDGTLYDEEGNPIGYIREGYVYDNEGFQIGVVDRGMSDSWAVDLYEQRSCEPLGESEEEYTPFHVTKMKRKEEEED